MKAIATFHQPTSVVCSIKTTLTEDEDVDYLVIAKSSILEVLAILPDSLRVQCSLEIWGRIASLQAVPTGETPRHHLLVLTDHPDPRLLLIEYAQGNAGFGPSLNSLKSVSLYERNARPAEFLNTCVVDHRGMVAVACSYTGKLRVLELQSGLINSEFDTSVRELNILSLCFLRTANSRATVLAILYRDYLQKLSVTSHELSISDLELTPSSSTFLPEFSVSDTDSNLLIPVPPQMKSAWNVNGGVLVLGGSLITFYSINRKQKKKNASAVPKASDVRVPQAEADWSFFDITAWSQIDEEGTRFLLGDSFGRLALLALDLERPILDIIFLGEVSPPTSLTPLASQFIYVGSHFGDSQLIRIAADKSSANGTYVDISETYKNIAPIMDAVVEDIDDSGQSTIITCSGGEGAGSLRVIRNGANFTEDARVDGIANTVGIWPLKKYYDDKYHRFILVTTDVSSHLLELPESHQKIYIARSNDLGDLRLDTPTLAAANVLIRVNSTAGISEYKSGSYLVQVTRDVVVLLNAQTGMSEDQWSPENSGKIVLADISASQICIAISGGLVILLNILDDKISEQSRRVFIEPNGTSSEISALTITPMNNSARFSSFVALGFWSSLKVKTFILPTFEPTEGVPADMYHLPRSLLFHEFGDKESGSHPYLMVGLANGAVVSLPFRKGKFGEKKFFTLGEAPISFSSCFVNNQPAVLASGTRSALFYWSKGALSHSPVLMKDVRSGSPLNTVTFASSMVLSTLDGLVIGRVLELDKLHIRTVCMATENPTRLAYHSTAKMFGVGCMKQDRGLSRDAVATVSSFKLINAMDFRTTHEFSLKANEEISAVAIVSLECENGYDTFFAVGSTYFDENEREPSHGRVLLFSTGTSRNQSPHLFAAAEARGAVNALACIKGKLVVAVNTSVDIFDLVSGDNNSNRLIRLTGWNHNYLIIAVVVAGDQIVVGDAVSSLAVLEFEGYKLVTVARDYSPLWPLCIEMFDKQTIIGANNDNNLFSYKLQQQGGKILLEQDGLYNMDETVNKCVPGRFDSSGNKFGLQTKHLLFTTTGRIAVVVDVNDDLSRLLSGLERNLAGVIKGPGDVDHTLWRAPSNSRGRSDAHAAAIGFLDGDLLKRFLDYPASSSEMVRILSGKNGAERIDTPYMQLRSTLESLRSTH